MSDGNNEEVFDCVIVGAGISGLVAADAMRAKGLSVLVLEKGRGVGGRMATRRVGEARCDHGAQFFTVSDDRFRSLVDRWEEKGVVAPWYQVDGGPLRYRALPSMTGITKHLAGQLEVRTKVKVERVSRENGLWSFDFDETVKARNLLLTCPAPQSVELLKNSGVKLDAESDSVLSNISYRRVLVTLLVLDGPSGLEEPGFMKFTDGGSLDVIADNLLRGSSPVSSVTVHSSHDFADENWDCPKDELVEKMKLMALPHLSASVVATDSHRWGFAHRVGDSDREFLALKELGLWLAGDSFATAKVEGAAISGLEVANAIGA